MTTGILIAGLWPFNFFPANQVRWLGNQDGVHFYGQAQISTASANPLNNSLSADHTLSLELWLKPSQSNYKAGVPIILSLYDGRYPDLLQIGQWRSHLLIRSRTDNPALRKRGRNHQELGFQNALLANQKVFITITDGIGGTSLFVNGNLIRSSPRHLIVSEVYRPVHLVSGNSASGQNGWEGFFYGLAIYRGTIDKKQAAINYRAWLANDLSTLKQQPGITNLFSFHERRGDRIADIINPFNSLSIPKVMTPLQRIILDTEFRADWSFASDVIVNIIGFIPLGFWVALLLRQRTRLSPIVLHTSVPFIGLALSLFIELTQIYLPMRYSQMSDVVSNTLGTVIGLVLFRIMPSITTTGCESLSTIKSRD